MSVHDAEVSIALPRDLWEQLLGQTHTSQQEGITLLIRIIEQFLQQEATRTALAKRLERECEELAAMSFEDAGTEDEWLIIQNEALKTQKAICPNDTIMGQVDEALRIAFDI